MIYVKLIGGAKKSFNSDQLEIEESEISIQALLDLLLKLKPHNTSDLDIENILIAVNGSDSSAMGGTCLLYTSPSQRDATLSRMPSSA